MRKCITNYFDKFILLIFLGIFLILTLLPAHADMIDQLEAIKIAESDAGCDRSKICQFDASSLEKGWYIIVRTVYGYRENGDPVLKPEWVGYLISSEGELLDKKPGR